MKISRLNAVLTVALLVIVVLVATVGADRSDPNVEFLPNMKRSPASSAYEKNLVFSSGRTMQTPVAGTIARDEMPLHYVGTPADAVRAGDELENPLASESPERQASIVRGGQRFQTFCTPCHGPGGKGDGPVVGKGYQAPTESLPTGKSREMKDGQLFHILTYGKYPEATTTPPRYPPMPSFAPQLSPAQRWDVINYVRSMQTANPIETAPPDSEASEPEPTPEEATPDEDKPETMPDEDEAAPASDEDEADSTG